MHKGSALLIVLLVAAAAALGGYWYLHQSSVPTSTFDARTGYYLKDKPLQRGEGASGSKGGYFIEDGAVYFGIAENGATEPWKIPVTHADTDTFFVLGGGTESDVYAKDTNNVYIAGTVVPGADPASFSLINLGNYAKDAHAVYQLVGESVRTERLEVVAGADPATFTVPVP